MMQEKQFIIEYKELFNEVKEFFKDFSLNYRQKLVYTLLNTLNSKDKQKFLWLFLRAINTKEKKLNKVYKLLVENMNSKRFEEISYVIVLGIISSD